MWNEINNQNDMDLFMEEMYGFHDSCIKEFKYLGGAYVEEELSMYPINEQRVLSLIIQRQFKDPSVLEMQFIGLQRLNFFPIDENYTCEIHDATMLFKDDYIYWLDCGGIPEEDFEDYEGMLICASKLRWRAADKYLGPEEVYVNRS